MRYVRARVFSRAHAGRRSRAVVGPFESAVAAPEDGATRRTAEAAERELAAFAVAEDVYEALRTARTLGLDLTQRRPEPVERERERERICAYEPRFRVGTVVLIRCTGLRTGGRGRIRSRLLGAPASRLRAQNICRALLPRCSKRTRPMSGVFAVATTHLISTWRPTSWYANHRI